MSKTVYRLIFGKDIVRKVLETIYLIKILSVNQKSLFVFQMTDFVSVYSVRSCLLYEFRLRTTAKEAARKLGVAFGEGVVSERVAQYWFRRFRAGCESLEDAPRSGRPAVIDNTVLKVEIESDPAQTCSKLAGIFHVDEETI